MASVPRRPDGYEHRRRLPLFVERRTDLAATGYRGHDGGRRCAEPFARHAGEGYARGGLQSRDLRSARSGGGRSAARRPCQGGGRLCAFGQAGGGADPVARGRPGAHPLRRRRQGGGICRLRRAPRFGRCEIVGAESVGADARKPDLPRRAGRQRRYPLDPRQACRPRAGGRGQGIPHGGLRGQPVEPLSGVGDHEGDDGQARASDRRRRAHFDRRTGARARHAQSGAQLRPLEVRAVRVADRRRRRRPHRRAQHGRLVEPRRAAESRIPLCRGQREGGLRPRTGLHRARQQHRNGL